MPFTGKPGGGSRNTKPRDRLEHSERISAQFEQAWSESAKSMEARLAVALPTADGRYLEFASSQGYDLVTKSLENITCGIRLMNVREVGIPPVTYATVFVPNSQEGYFLKKIQEYAHEVTPIKGNPKHKNLVESIEDVRLALVKSFWQDPPTLQPGNTPLWCEIWLSKDDMDTENTFRNLCESLGIACGAGSISFPERRVLAAEVSSDHLATFIESFSHIAEFRRVKETARFFLEESNLDQVAWVDDLVARLSVSNDSPVSVCILDTGANNGHPLLESVLSDEDRQSCEPAWGVDDHHGHGTEMCGVVAYGDLKRALESRLPVRIDHRLESVKILPPTGTNDDKLFGYLTAQAIGRAEISAPMRHRIVCMAVTYDDPGFRGEPVEDDRKYRGRPSAWSAAIDELASGYVDGEHRLFVLCAGNTDDLADLSAYPHSNLTNSIQDPAQSWNALTVGACTELTTITDPALIGHEVVARPGSISPYTTTSLTWETGKWPSKPDIVMEGGNCVRNPGDGFVSGCHDLSLVTTYYRHTNYQFTHFSCTSAATARAAHMAAQIQYLYPDAWPETVRALMVHSAEWTTVMKEQFQQGKAAKSGYADLLRICGYGIPNLTRARECAENSLTIISQAEMQPFTKENGTYRSNEMHLYELPWPRETLLELGDVAIAMRITLSYFIEPGPGELGWQNRYRYQSHALRFDLNRPGESKEAFISRINRAAREEDDDRKHPSDDRWTIGSQARSRGSIHSDMWEGTAADIAACNNIGVFPVIGWWRERPTEDRWNRRARYSLVVSLRTQVEETDLYTPVLNKLRIPVEIAVW